MLQWPLTIHQDGGHNSHQVGGAGKTGVDDLYPLEKLDWWLRGGHGQVSTSNTILPGNAILCWWLQLNKVEIFSSRLWFQWKWKYFDNESNLPWEWFLSSPIICNNVFFLPIPCWFIEKATNKILQTLIFFMKQFGRCNYHSYMHITFEEKSINFSKS